MILLFEPLVEAFDDATLPDFVKGRDVFAILGRFILR